MADALIAQLREGVAAVTVAAARAPTLAVVPVGEEPANAIHVRRELDACRRAGIISREHRSTGRYRD